jgi:HK97 family phage portal protein
MSRKRRGLFDRIRAIRAAVSYMSDPDAWFTQWIQGGPPVASGVTVNEATAMSLAAVYACVRILARTVASLPIHVYRRLDRGKERATEHSLYQLLHVAPNPEQTAYQFKELLEGHVALYGNAYAQKVLDGGGRTRELWPLNPLKTTPMRRGGRKVYEYRRGEEKEVILPAEQVLHIPGFGFDGLVGYSPIEVTKNTVGLAIATQKHGEMFFGNNARPDGILSIQGTLRDEAARKRLRDSWTDMHSGDNQHKVAVLEQGAQFTPLTIPPDHAQFIESRKLSIADIARIFQVPLHMISELDRATFSNIEHQAIEFVVHTIRPWLVLWEQSLTMQLLSPREQKEFFAEFLIDSLLRGDIKARYEAYSSGINSGWLTRNEVRERESLNPIDGLDEPLSPMNMQSGQEDEPEEEENARPGPPEKRAAAISREKVTRAFRPVFEDVAGRIIRKEGRDIRSALDEHMRKRDLPELDGWLERYYEELPEYMRRELTPVYRSLSEAVKAAVQDELSAEIVLEDDRFLRDYVDAYIGRHIKSSTGQVRDVKGRAAIEGGDIEALIDERLTEWEEKRPGKIAADETVRGSNALAKVFYIAAGVTTLRWIALGVKSCPYCQQLDGMVVGVERDFVMPSQVLDSDQGEMKVNRSTGHPPLHAGCVCQIMAG